MKTKIKSAAVTTLMFAILAMGLYVLKVGDVFALDFKVLINTGVMALVAGVVSFIKSTGTTEDGIFAGVQVK